MSKPILVTVFAVLMLLAQMPPVLSVTDIQVKDLIESPGASITNFDSLNGWSVSGVGATQVLETVDKVEGTASIKLTTNYPGGYIVRQISQNVDSAKVFSFWIKIDYQSFVRVHIDFSSTAGFTKYLRKTIGYVDTNPGWTHLVIDPSTFTSVGGESWTGIKYVRFYVTPQYKISQTSVNLDDLTIDLQAKAKAVITFDDGYSSDYLLAKPIMEANNQRGVSFVIPARIGASASYMTLSQLTEMYNSGWDISSHTLNHVSNSLNHMSAIQLDTELNGGYNWLISKGFTRSAMFIAYPFGYGYDNATVVNKVKENYIFARTTKSGTYQSLLSSTVSDPWYALRGVEVLNIDTPESVIADIDQTIKQKGLIVIMYHHITTGAETNDYYYPTSKFKIISDYLASKSDYIDVVTLSDMVTTQQPVTKYTLNTGIVGSGSVTKNPDKLTYSVGEKVDLTANAATGWSFNNWSGAVSGSGNPITVSMDDDKTITATFTQNNYPLNIQPPSGSGSTNPTTGTYNYPSGTIASITATASSGNIFDHWLIDGNNAGSTNPIAVTMNAGHSIQAIFIVIPSTTYTVTLTQTTGGIIAASPSGPYVAGTVVKLTATPSPGYKLKNWVIDGVNDGTTNPGSLTVSKNHNVQAVFTPTTSYYIVELINAVGATWDETGTYLPAGTYYIPIGKSIAFKVIPNAGYTWTGYNYWINGKISTFPGTATNPDTFMSNSVGRRFTIQPVMKTAP
jgi:peptidoglycan/xylan/chitin deacetylase (PgdA/CDA1 family)